MQACSEAITAPRCSEAITKSICSEAMMIQSSSSQDMLLAGRINADMMFVSRDLAGFEMNVEYNMLVAPDNNEDISKIVWFG